VSSANHTLTDTVNARHAEGVPVADIPVVTAAIRTIHPTITAPRTL